MPTGSAYWHDVKSALAGMSQDKRAGNRENSPKLLDAAGIAYTVHNGGAHLIVRHVGITVDFWPGTGMWTPRKGSPKPRQKEPRGVRPLILYLLTAAEVTRG